MKLYPHEKIYKSTHTFYEKITWDGNIKKKTSGRYTHCKDCIAVDLILKYSQNHSKLRRSDTLFLY